MFDALEAKADGLNAGDIEILEKAYLKVLSQTDRSLSDSERRLLNRFIRSAGASKLRLPREWHDPIKVIAEEAMKNFRIKEGVLPVQTSRSPGLGLRTWNAEGLSAAQHRTSPLFKGTERRK